jgi:hypothetical protein
LPRIIVKKKVKKMKNKSIILLIIGFIVCAYGLKAQNPTVTMVSVDSISCNQVRFNANYSSAGSWTVNQRGFIWDTVPNPVKWSNSSNIQFFGGSTIGNYSYYINTITKYLNPNTTYYVKAWVKKGTSAATYDTTFSAAISFTTPSCNCPGSTADSATDIGLTVATINGTVVNKGSAYQITGKGFMYGITPEPTSTTGTKVNIAGSVTTFPKTISSSLTGLLSGQTYYYRTWVASKYSNTLIDTCYSEDNTFITEHACGNIPLNLTRDEVSVYTAKLHWTPREGQVQWQIDYDYAGHTVGEGQLVISNNDTVELTGLTGGRSYSAYVRAVCSDRYSDWSNICTFTTVAPPCAEVSGIHTSEITHSSAKVEWTPGSMTQTKWEVLFSKATDILPTTGVTIINSPIFCPVGLTPSTQYKLKIRANCDPYYSDWSDEFSFTTIQMGLNDVDAESLNKVLIFPNPTENIVRFDAQKAKVENIEIYSSLGTLVYKNEVLPKEFNFSKFGSGMYFINITTQKGVQIEKIIVK